MGNNSLIKTKSQTYLSIISFLNFYSWDVKSYSCSTNEFNKSNKLVTFGYFLKKANIQKIKIEDDKIYKILGVRSYGKGVYVNRTVKGNTLKMREYQCAKTNHLFWCKVDTKNGAFGVINDALADGIASSNMTFAEIDTSRINVEFLQILFSSKGIMQYLDSYVTGTTNRKYIRPEQLFNDIKVPLPRIEAQNRIVETYRRHILESIEYENKANYLEKHLETYFFEKLGIQNLVTKKITKGLRIINFYNLNEWGIDKLCANRNSDSLKFNIVSIADTPKLALSIFRGKSPKYAESSKSFILNQKCNRWNELDLSFVKTVDENWFNSINKLFFTREGDVLINSTGEGTIGRASNISKSFEGLLYDSHLLLLRLDLVLVNPEFFVEIFNSSYGQSQVNEIKSAQATKQTELGVNNLMRINFPLPNMGIQNEIVDYIKYTRSEINSLRSNSKLSSKLASDELEKEIFNL